MYTRQAHACERLIPSTDFSHVGSLGYSTTSGLMPTDLSYSSYIVGGKHVPQMDGTHQDASVTDRCRFHPVAHRLGTRFASFPVLYNSNIKLCHGIKSCIIVK